MLEDPPQYEVTRYDHPHIFVRNRGIGETYKLVVDDSLTLTQQGDDVGRFDLGDARRAAIAYLFRSKRAA